MKSIIKARWLILAVWLVATALLVLFQPDFNAILRHRGQQILDSRSPSVLADSMLDRMDATKGTNDLLVFYDRNKLSGEEMKRIEAGVKAIADSQADLGIGKIIDPFSLPEAKRSLLSQDGTTLMVSFKLDKGSREVADIRKSIERKLDGVQAEHYLTGVDFLNEDYLDASLAGVEKSAILTVLFILVVLILMFRSLVTPLVSLLTVGVSYFCSMGIAAQLIDKAGFPLTTLTQVLLILILFGIGTDYNILLFNRFKEELFKGLSTDEAIVNTYRTAGKTIALSALTVLIAFLSLVLSESPIYQSGVVVVIGAAVFLLQIITLTPLAMKVFGKKLFWPSRKAAGHKESKLWHKITSASVRHPLISVAVIGLIIAPTIYLHQQKLSFDTIGELGDSHPSAKAFNLVAAHFGRGQAMPLSIVIENGQALDNNESLSVIDGLTERLKKIGGVSQVSSATQPEGQPIDNFYLSRNMQAVTGGLAKSQDGLDQIRDGLKLAQAKLGSADFSRVGEMVEAAAGLKAGLSALTGGLKQIQAGIKDGSQDSQTISNGLASIEGNLARMSGGVKLLAGNYEKMQSGYVAMGASYQEAAQALLGVKSALAQMQPMVTALGSSYADAGRDPNYLGIKQLIDALSASLSSLTPAGIKTLNENYRALTSGFETANQSLSQIGGGLSQMAGGLSEIEGGLERSASGLVTIVTNLDKVDGGLGQMESGMRTLQTGLNGFGAFGSNLSEVNNGLRQISDGLGKTNGYLSQLTVNKTFFIPREALADQSFRKSLDMFMSDGRTYTKLVVVLKDDPYSRKALDTVKEIKTTVANGLAGTVLSGAKHGVSGPSATTSEMNEVLNRDLNRMIVIVLIGVFLVLLLVTRSFWRPVFITASLVGAYYAAIFAINTLFITWLGMEGIASFVPFFAFLAIVALGGDYSIFLMMRFKEYPQLSPGEAIVMASRHIGGVVMSAAVILGGTFATLIPSGMILLSELAVAVMAGLFVLCFVLLPVFLPATIALPSAADRFFAKVRGSLSRRTKKISPGD